MKKNVSYSWSIGNMQSMNSEQCIYFILRFFIARILYDKVQRNNVKKYIMLMDILLHNNEINNVHFTI